MDLQATRWFTEICEECGMAISLCQDACLYDAHSDYQHIQVYRTATFGHLLVIDGFIMLTARDNHIYHEMLVHPALFSHPRPRDVLIIGGGDCGTLREVLRHPDVERVTQVELDEQVTRVCERFFPELCSANDDPRADLQFTDGIAWVENMADRSVDVIIVDSTDPIGPAEGLFSEPFYRQCHRALRSDGLLIQQSESPLVHLESIIQPMHAAMQQAGFNEVKLLHFPQPTYPSGWWSASLASVTGQVAYSREAAAAELATQLRYYNPGVHRGAMALPQALLSTSAGRQP